MFCFKDINVLLFVKILLANRGGVIKSYHPCIGVGHKNKFTWGTGLQKYVAVVGWGYKNM